MKLVPRKSFFDMDQLFPEWLHHGPSSGLMTPTTFAPKVDILEQDNQYRIVADLPGVKREDIHVHLDNGILTLEAKVEQEDREEKEGKVIRSERFTGSYLRRFDVGDDVSDSDIKAEFKDGVLTLTAPKKEPSERPATKIEIK
ncbi:Hsp20/alpha crystallin family protein [Biformimicrobium ophioploci]|uniref:Hsp20/alpha crystallin family protein n=1 Tax=Biformimicrobium ophioploci TaxID=3036711 RepID=A0ABQ6M077_9GAMM|nr:Hsp20/alpha crystallin family protein [Microbulbifer sp. NKW57]GMG87702.1 Hsp20/alpha crystallin family protein [Microbulbifer sp. NKW57]